ncbi:MAG: ATP-binding protein [Ignavibacteriae bacterium HGW-Ignavibacteriae-1]|jgi:anti-sigma regulatory factor (Ser/Thr protein kinase)|nr:MAG: ATP-binding protein [Ignavibacteriae bacterium HGW-Ignavibacteriae-1]
MKLNIDIKLRNEISELRTLASGLETFAEQAELAPKVAYNLSLCLDELVTNIINYGYPKHENGEIDINIKSDTDKITITISDSGIEFNPLDRESPNVEAPLEERTVGGLGIFIVKKLCDSITYRRSHGRNILTLTMKI